MLADKLGLSGDGTFRDVPHWMTRTLLWA